MLERDPWAGRKTGMLCSTCVFFVQKGTSEGFGRCRRHSPTLAGFPAVFGHDWCGDHRLDEDKIKTSMPTEFGKD